MKNKMYMALGLVGLTLVSCTPENNVIGNWQKVYSPSGAPTLAFYDQGKTGTFSTNTTPANVLAQLQTDNYGMVVFDFYNGLKSIKTNTSNYKLAKILTGGNLYLVGINKTSAPTKDDYIVSFGQNLVPDIVYKKIYGDEIATATHYVGAVADAQGVLTSGLHEGNPVDYVLIAQPALYATLSNQGAATYGKLSVIASLRTEWKTLTGQDAIPQAGLFVNTEYYANHKQFFDDQFDLIDERIDTCINDPLTMKQKIDSDLDTDSQKALFGFTSQIAYNVQTSETSPNGFALVSGDEQVDIQEFLTSINVTDDYSSYIM